MARLKFEPPDIKKIADLYTLMFRILFPVCLLGIVFLGGCIVAPKYSDIPEIKFEGINKNLVDQGRVRDDSIMIRISFTDGDGDIGDEKNKANIFMIDNRDGKMITYSMPMIPQKGTANGVAGTITILHTTLFNVCCYYKNGGDPCTIPAKPTTDTVRYKLYIEDRSGNKSNILNLDPIVINCK